MNLLFAVKLIHPGVVPLVQQTYLGDAVVVAVVIACFVAYGLALRELTFPPMVKRFVLALALAVMLSLTVGVTSAYAVMIGPCEWADYWWAWWC